MVSVMFLAELRHFGQSVAGATDWGGDNDTFARQVLSKRPVRPFRRTLQVP
ncbi:hypothetical protein F4695_004514 [Rhizobium soli]|uniref:Uncharacterized protein n=1 Tax=Rhizobium soli TaxID=424798 RepID=A0A7X0JNX5_9HYPH|nr:hypothetical protein [Rhizobium soli]